MTRPHRNRPLVFALYLNAGLLAAILLAMVSRGGTGALLPSAQAAIPAPAPIAGGNGMYVMPAQFLSQVWGCYVLDTEQQTLAAYGWYGVASKPELKLIGARNIRWDRKLTNFNTSPDPEEIHKLTDLQQNPIRGARRAVEPANAPATQPAAVQELNQ
jgi:hypothetical protein